MPGAINRDPAEQGEGPHEWWGLEEHTALHPI